MDLIDEQHQKHMAYDERMKNFTLYGLSLDKVYQAICFAREHGWEDTPDAKWERRI